MGAMSCLSFPCPPKVPIPHLFTAAVHAFLFKLDSIKVCEVRQSINQSITFNENISVTVRTPEPSFPSSQRWVPWQFWDDLFSKHKDQGGIRMWLMLMGSHRLISPSFNGDMISSCHSFRVACLSFPFYFFYFYHADADSHLRCFSI